ncbi:hypothetical protein CWI38_0199p0010 [Hamiltosporidium tvaerminnensis]|uniref:Integrase catalytic domain-containing protein n=1 Tax=Hamiltosporidium tvaerminnensis TaxID=1176355 RepID=A0A4Q9M1F4_9MICR|nr:hypothetical protein CWI38_0199p0010 [Hamiltosporidium tvaerminnensis]
MMALIAQKYYGIPKEYVKEYEKRLINKTSKLVRYSLKFLFDNIGVPVAIQSDNGQVERVNQTIKRWLAKKLHETGGRSWIEHLNNVILTPTNTIIPDDLASNSKIRSDVAKPYKNYRERIIESKNSNKLKRDFSIGHQVLIKKTSI